MKKFLISTTALVAIAASSAFAEMPTTPANALTVPDTGLTVSAGGIVDFQAGFRNQKRGYKVDLSQNNRSVAFMGHAKAYLAATARADVGFNYGGVIQLATNVTNYSGHKDARMEHTYVFTESGLGRVELGTNSAASQAMKVDAASIARATGGIDGDWDNYVNVNQYTANPGEAPTVLSSSIMTSPDFLSSYRYSSRESSEKARKISYYSPRMNGLQFGVSYTPDTEVVGKYYGINGTQSALNRLARDPRPIKNLVGGGFNYTNQFDQLTLSASLLGEAGTAKKKDTEAGKLHRDLRAWQAGAQLDYAGFSVAGSYGATNKKFSNVIPVGANSDVKYKDLKYWTAGVAYAQGPVGVSVTYMDSDWMKNKFSNLAVGADYQLAPGLMPYVEASFFNLKPNRVDYPVVKKNRGQSYIVGTELRF